MPSSELSNALNPFIHLSAQRHPDQSYDVLLQPVVQPPQRHVPHRSELELAISEPPPPPPATVTAKTRQPTPANVQAVHGLLRMVAATREAQENERKRRLQWEQEQEMKFGQKQAEMESYIQELRQEILALRALIPQQPSELSNIQQAASSSLPTVATQLASPVSPVDNSPYYSYPEFQEGSSPVQIPSSNVPFQTFDDEPPRRPQMPYDDQESISVTLSPFPHLENVIPAESPDRATASTRKRRKHAISSDEEGRSSSDTSLSSLRAKRANHHDKSPYTIHHALRIHILQMMNLNNDKELPDSHVEGSPLRDDEPVRFVWDKTIKQSVHNSRMKARILGDIRSNRKLYRNVANRDFSKKVLDAAFDQTYTTLRQKFKAQRDSDSAVLYKKREDAKAQKARHLSRRKIKLSNRADARVKVGCFEHVIFDGALQLECMSSEESDVEPADDGSDRQLEILRTRGYAWRSARLLKFYYILDEEERVDKLSKPRRGSGKKERRQGPPKEGLHVPPKGAASWMISKSWLKTSQRTYPELSDMLRKVVHNPSGFDRDQFDVLGQDSDDLEDR